MKKYILVSLISVVLFACNNKADKSDAEEFALVEKPKATVWESILNDSTGNLEMKKTAVGKLDTISTEAVMSYLNTINPNIRLDTVKTSHDTLFLKIDDATYLTQQMGSTGPTLYLAAVVYNLTELTGIKFIHFDFEEGDHAGPGTFSRESFNNQ